MNKQLSVLLRRKADWVREQTLKIHSSAPETRIASSLSPVEIFTVLYYGGILRFNPKKPELPSRDRLIVSKGHGGVSLYPILADLGYFEKSRLKCVCREESALGSIPDCAVPGFETINGSLGQGLGQACGMALGLKKKGAGAKVFTLLGDGELYEGSTWEALMFASHHQLDNLIVIVDNNHISMLDYCTRTLDIEPIEDKFRVFNYLVKTANGHDVTDLFNALDSLKNAPEPRPRALVANTVKGKGVPQLEKDALCHVRSLTPDEVRVILEKA